jgi:hypothetical protein
MTIKTTITGPLLVIDALDVLSLNDLPQLFDAFDTAGRAGPFVVLTDTTQMKSAPRAVLSAFADGLKKKTSISKLWLGDAVVVSSPAVRFMLSTLLIVAPMPTEVKVFDQRQAAQRWCAEILRNAGISLPQPLRPAQA